jgi:hypothetical protein
MQVVMSLELAVPKELANRGRNCFRCLLRALVFSDHDVFPFVKKSVGPDQLVEAVLAER